MNFRNIRESPWAEMEKLWEIKTSEWRFQRPLNKIGRCRQCGWCYLFCPTGCIVDKGTHFAANMDFCKGCGICAHECSANAIIMIREEVP